MSNTYSASKIVLTVAGIRVTGFGETDMVNVERDESKFIKITGADGVVSRSHIVSNAGQITITLQQTSAANDVLTGLLLADEVSLAAQFPVTIKDLNGSTNIIAADCWIQGPPAVPMNKLITDRVWIIDVADLSMFIGGNDGGLLTGAVGQIAAIGQSILT